MVHLTKRIWLLPVILMLGASSAFGFSLLGPQLVDAFQVNAIGYFESPPASTFENLGAGVDVGAPKNIAEGYRWNTKILYYAYDGTFLDYFGSNGIVAVDKAFAFYNSLSNLSSYSAGLTEFPLNSSRINYQAAALNLIDLKSVTMSLLIEQLGLAQPERWTWCLHDRFLPGGATCPAYEYIVIQRNFDPISQLYSPYVNGVLYDYEVLELCGLQNNPYNPLQADAVEIAPDGSMLADGYGAISAFEASQVSGQFYTGFTRDDIGGLRYLMGTNRLNVESVDPTSQQLFTNTTQIQLLTTQDLNIFSQQAITNDPVTLAGLYPGLIVTQSSNYFSNVVTTNITAFFTNLPNSAPGSAATLVQVTNFTTNVGTFFVNTFANVVTNHLYTKGYLTFQIFSNTVPNNSPPGAAPQTNTITKTIYTNFINGDFYIIPPTALCGTGFQIVSTQLVSTITITNSITIATNSSTTTNLNGQTFTNLVLTYFTNYNLLVYPIQCLGGSNTVVLREGMDKINFVRQDFDSLLNGFWEPVTNFYTLTAVTNNAAVTQTFRRVATAPDILFLAADLATGPAANLAVVEDTRTTPNYNSAQALRGLAGPGTMNIGAGINFTFDKVGPAFVTAGGFFLSGGIGVATSANFAPAFLWGNFDGTTNAPIVFPDGTSLAGLQSQVFFQITNNAPLAASVSSNTIAHPFNLQLGAAGGSPPFTWSLTTNSPALPPGFTLSSGGLLTGVPTKQGVYDFVVQAKDIGLRVAEAELTIQIGP